MTDAQRRRRDHYVYASALVGASLSGFDWNFVTGRYISETAGLSTSLSWPPAPATFTRASLGWRCNQSGLLEEMATNTPRFDHDYASIRTNYIRNNSNVGAQAGTPGVLPTRWVSSTGGLTQTIIGAGTSEGVPYIDIRFAGTTNTTLAVLNFETSSGCAAVVGDVRTISAYVALLGGSTTNITSIQLIGQNYDSGPAFVGADLVATITPTATMSRVTASGTISTATTAYLQPYLKFNFSSGVAVDITLRIGGVMMEDRSSAGDFIATSGAAATSAPTPLGLLREGQATNLVTYSQVSTGWLVAGGCTIADNNATAPDGNTTAALVTKTAAAGVAGAYYVGSATVAASTVYTASFWCKLGTALAADMRYSLYDETGAAFFAIEVAYTQTATASGWTRMQATFTTPVGCVSMRFYPWRYINAAAGATIYAWGHQVEAGAFATSYVKTAGATATRAVDDTYLPMPAGLLGPQGVSMAGEFDLLSNSQTSALFGYAGAGGFTDTTYATMVNSTFSFVSIVATVGVSSGSGTLGTAGTVQKAAFALSPSRLSGALNGTALTSVAGNGIHAGTTVTPAAAPWNSANTTAPDMHVRRLRMWPRALSTSELQQATT